jgi:hypothetical protein
MALTRGKFLGSGIAGLFAVAFLGSGALCCTSFATPAFWFYIVLGGIAASSAVAMYLWRAERRKDPKASAAGPWMVFAVLVVLLLPCIGYALIMMSRYR